MTRFFALLLLLVMSTPLRAQDAKLTERAAKNRVKGNPQATVVVYEIADFQCPFCARFAREVFPRIDSAFVRSGKVQWVFVNLPLPNHPHAWTAAETAMCAGAANDKFWPMHDLIFERQPRWTNTRDAAAIFTGYAKELSLDEAAFEKCVAEDQVAALIIRDVMMSTSVRVTGTPAFSINGAQSFSGLRSFEEWRDLLEAALKQPKQ
jgi:protein-disulfide isomerase